MHIINSSSIVHINSSDGHRLPYLNLLSNILQLNRSIGNTRNIATFYKLILAKALLIASLDDDVLGFVIISLIRALFRRNTVALFIRPQSCFGNNIKSNIKYFIFWSLSKVKAIKIFIIVPSFIGNDYHKVSTDWVHDPQMWDVFDSPKIESLSLSETIFRNAKNRKIISFIGRVSLDKGIATLINLINHNDNLCNSYFFVIAGIFDSEAIKLFESVKAKNIILINRHLSNSEINSIYYKSSLIWCCYNKTYDQASGIFGRSVQYGKIAIVRKGSSIEMIARHYDIPILTIDPLSLDEAIMSLINSKHEINTCRDLTLFTQWKNDFISKVIANM
jgi:glycosyltransferase involved in cell wall biosynthesis